MIDVDTSELDGIAPKIEKLMKDLHGATGARTNPVRSSARKMAKIVEAEAKRLAPVGEPGPGRAPGRLKNAITTKLIGMKYRDMATDVGNSREYFFVGARTSSNRFKDAWYATPVEQGWEKSHSRYDGAHFLRSALMNKRDEAVVAFIKAINGHITRLTNKIKNLP